MPRPKGSKNKVTLQREFIERERMNLIAAMPAHQRRKLAKERVEEFANKFSDLAEIYGPYPEWRVEGDRKVNANPNYNEESYRYYSALAARTFLDLAQFQSPKLSAIAVGQVSKMVVVVKGGLPPRDTTTAPALPAPENGVVNDAGVNAAGRVR
jgi:hypothetical protein